MTSIYIYKEKLRPSNKLIKVISIIRVVFGMYSEVCRNFYVSILIKLYCIIATICLVYYGRGILSIQDLIDYSVASILSILSQNQHFLMFLSKINIIDDELDFKGDFMEGHITFYVFFALMVIKYSTIAAYVAKIPFPIPLKIHVVMLFSSTSLSISQFPVIIIFEILWHRIKFLRKTMKYTLVSFRVRDKRLNENNLKIIVYYLKIYSKLLDNLDDTGIAPKIHVIFCPIF